MQAEFLDGLAPFEWPLSSGDLGAACGRVADHRESLLPAERQALAKVGERRGAEFSSGRRVARAALQGIGLHDVAIGRRGRAPAWPSCVVGSIAHSRRLAIALVGRSARYAAIGLDVEPLGRTTRRVAERVLSQRERAGLADDSWHTLLFSAKEAVYKAVNPLVGEFLEFRDVEVAAGGGRFKAATRRHLASTAAVASGEGFFLSIYGHWLPIFVCRAGTARCG